MEKEIKELAEKFVSNYSNMFKEDKWFWIQELEKLMNSALETASKQSKN